MSVEQLNVELEADTGEFTDNIRDATEALENLKMAIEDVNEALDRLNESEIEISVDGAES